MLGDGIAPRVSSERGGAMDRANGWGPTVPQAGGWIVMFDKRNCFDDVLSSSRVGSGALA